MIVKIIEGSQDTEWQMMDKMSVEIPGQLREKNYFFYKKTDKNCYN